MKFSKSGSAVYISHLDLMRTLQRAFSRAGIALKYSEGFNPHAKISIILPLSVGMHSKCEYLDFCLAEERPVSEIPKILNPFLPEGLEAIEAYVAPGKGAELRWLHISGFIESIHDASFFNSFFSQPKINVKRRSKRGERNDDIAPMIKKALFTDLTDGIGADLVIHAQEPTLNPEVMMKALGGDIPEYYTFTRLEAFRGDMTPFR